VSVALNIGLNLALVRVAGFQGLALGTAIAATMNAALLLWMLRGRIGGLDGGRNARAFIKITFASLAMGAAAWAVHHALEAALPGSGTPVRAVRVFSAIGVALAVLVAVARLLRIEEFEGALSRVTARLGLS
jgi:putative peptidoglycan lipid II flippase